MSVGVVQPIFTSSLGAAGRVSVMFASEIFGNILSVSYRSAASGCVLGYTHQASKSGFTLLVPGLLLAGINITMLSVRLWFLIFITAPVGQAVLADPSLLREGSSRGRDCELSLALVAVWHH